VMAEAAEKDKGDKPVRVMEREVTVGKCPLCGKPLLAQVEIEVRLGELEVGKAVDEETGEITASIDALTRLRKLKIEHECTAPAVKPRVRRPRTPRAPGSAPPAAPPADEPPIPIDLLPPPDSPVWTGEPEPDPEPEAEETNDEEKEQVS
jgi:hypothetical protein